MVELNECASNSFEIENIHFRKHLIPIQNNEQESIFERRMSSQDLSSLRTQIIRPVSPSSSVILGLLTIGFSE